MPGTPTVEIEDSWKIDFQKPKGKDGYKVKDEGYEGADVDISIVITTLEELTALAKILPTIRPAKKGGKRQPLEIQHPTALVAGVSTIAIQKIKIRQPSARDGWVIEIKAKEWLASAKESTGLGGVKGGGAHSCAWIAAQLQQKHHEESALAAEIAHAQESGFGTPDAALLKFPKVQAQRKALEAQLNKCAAGGGVPPPSSTSKNAVAA